MRTSGSRREKEAALKGTHRRYRVEADAATSHGKEEEDVLKLHKGLNYLVGRLTSLIVSECHKAVKK
jgi:hypothetical protein